MASMRSSLLTVANPVPPPDIPPPPPPRPPPPPPPPPRCANPTATARTPINRIRRVISVPPAAAPAGTAHAGVGAGAHVHSASHASAAATGDGREEDTGHQLERLRRIVLLVGLQLCVDLREGV